MNSELLLRVRTPRRARMGFGSGLAALIAMASAPAQAIEELPAEPAPEASERAQKGHAGAQRDTYSVETPAGSFALKSRVFVRADLLRQHQNLVNSGGVVESRDLDSLDLSVPSARVSLRYHSRLKWLFAEIEVDVAGKPDLKDGYILAKDKHWAAQFGQFKMPVSALELESPWALPLAQRGFLSDILVDRLDIAGRRPGATFAWRARGAFNPRVTLGAFQGSVLTEIEDGKRKTDRIAERGLGAQSWVARAEVGTKGVQVGAFYEHRVGSPSVLITDHYWTAGADLLIDKEFSHGGLRIWADTIAGESWFEHSQKPVDGRNATFVSARGLAAYRFGGVEDEDVYLEPFALVGGLDPDLDVSRDWAWEVALGANLGFWRRARLTLEAEKYEVLRNFPESYFLGRDPDRIGLTLQAGVAF